MLEGGLVEWGVEIGGVDFVVFGVEGVEGVFKSFGWGVVEGVGDVVVVEWVCLVVEYLEGGLGVVVGEGEWGVESGYGCGGVWSFWRCGVFGGEVVYEEVEVWVEGVVEFGEELLVYLFLGGEFVVGGIFVVYDGLEIDLDKFVGEGVLLGVDFVMLGCEKIGVCVVGDVV